MPFTLQLTPVFDVPVTVAVNGCVFPSNTLELEDETTTVTGCAGGGTGEDVPPQLERLAARHAVMNAGRTERIQPSRDLGMAIPYRSTSRVPP